MLFVFLFHAAVPPAYYAHLAAFRARFYLLADTSDNGSTTNGASGRGARSPRGHGTAAAPASPAPVKPLPALKENVKKVMFFC